MENDDGPTPFSYHIPRRPLHEKISPMFSIGKRNFKEKREEVERVGKRSGTIRIILLPTSPIIIEKQLGQRRIIIK